MNKTEYLLTQMASECNEIAHRISKALQFGLDEKEPGQPFTNAERVLQETHDFLAVEEMVHEIGALPAFEPEAIDAWIEAKKVKVEKFMAYARTQGTLV